MCGGHFPRLGQGLPQPHPRPCPYPWPSPGVGSVCPCALCPGGWGPCPSLPAVPAQLPLSAPTPGGGQEAPQCRLQGVFRRLERAREAAPLGPGRGIRVWVGYMGASGSPGRQVTWRLWPCGHSVCPWAPLPGVSTSGGARQAPWCESERARAGAGGGGRGGHRPGHLGCEVGTRSLPCLCRRSHSETVLGACWAPGRACCSPLSVGCSWQNHKCPQATAGLPRVINFCVASLTKSWAGSRPPQSSALPDCDV